MNSNPMKQIQLAGCVIYNSGKKILLIHRNTHNRVQWELPGGKIDEGENPESTAKRELIEELGIKVNILRKLGEKTFTENGFVMNYIWLLAEISFGTPAPIEEKFDKINYFSWNELKENKLHLSENVRNLVQAHFKNELNEN